MLIYTCEEIETMKKFWYLMLALGLSAALLGCGGYTTPVEDVGES